MSGAGAPHTPAGWRAWYADGSVFSSRGTAWASLPATALQVVVVYMRERTRAGWPYRHRLTGCDWYWMDERGAIRGVPSREWGVEQPPPAAPPQMVKRGTGVSLECFERLTMQATQARTLD